MQTRAAARVYHRTHIRVRERDPRARFGQVQRSAHQSNTRLARRLGQPHVEPNDPNRRHGGQGRAPKRPTAECPLDVRGEVRNGAR
jgi:hypothetical protein